VAGSLRLVSLPSPSLPPSVSTLRLLTLSIASTSSGFQSSTVSIAGSFTSAYVSFRATTTTLSASASKAGASKRVRFSATASAWPLDSPPGLLLLPTSSRVASSPA